LDRENRLDHETHENSFILRLISVRSLSPRPQRSTAPTSTCTSTRFLSDFLPDALWARIAPLLPPEPPKPKGGRPRASDRAALTGIFSLRFLG
jgi:hypothetical protein